MQDIVFENKYARLHAFLLPFTGMMIIAAMSLVRILVKDIPDPVRKIRFILIVVGAAIVLGIIFGSISALRTKKVRITVGSGKIRVIRGKAEGTYEIEDIVRFQREVKRSGRNMSVVRSLVFKDEDGDLLYIDCDGFSDKKFIQLADVIRVRKHQLCEDTEADLKDKLEGDSYEGTYNPSSGKHILLLDVFYVIANLVLLVGLFWLISHGGITRMVIAMIICMCFGLSLYLVIRIWLALLVKKQKNSAVRSIKIGFADITVNDDKWDYSDITKAYITQPYLTDICGEHRSLILWGKDTDKAVRYLIDARPAVFEPDSDEYIKLYNSVTDIFESRGIEIGQYDLI